MDGHIQLRRGLYPHLKQGRMTMDELAVFVYLQFIADFRNGKAKTSAPHIYYETGRNMPLRKIQRILESLEKKRYIRRFMVDGRKGDYIVLIHKFRPTLGAWTGKYLNAFKCEDYNDFVFEDRVDDDAESDVDVDADNDAETGDDTGEYVKNSKKNSTENFTKKLNGEVKELSLSIARSSETEFPLETEIPSEPVGDEELDVERMESESYAQSHARDLIIQVKRGFFGILNYTVSDERLYLPAFTELMERHSVSHSYPEYWYKLVWFSDWMVQFGFADRILSLKDFLFHWNNESGNDRGFRHQFEGWWRKVGKEKQDSKEFAASAATFAKG